MKIQFIADPLRKNQHINTLQLIDILGYIPRWAMDEDFAHLPLKEALEIQYGFGPLHKWSNCTVSTQGILSYPGDPDLYPLMKIIRGDETLFQYEFGIVAIVNKDETFVTRMD